MKMIGNNILKESKRNFQKRAFGLKKGTIRLY